MKPGDKVWVYNFATQKIEQVEIDTMVVGGGSGTYMRGGDFGYRVSFRPYYEPSPPARRCANITGRYLSRTL